MAIESQPERAAIYCRISKDLAGTRLGVARQQELCEKLAAEKGWHVGQIYVDNDVSAYSGQPRPAYERMLADLESGIVDGVLVVDQDRLTRHPMELEAFIILADRLAVPIANVSGEIDLSTSDGRFRARILGAVARQESEKKSERIRRQKDQAAVKGRAHGGIRRYGYRHARGDDGEATLEIVPEEADRIRDAAQRVLDGESLRSIAISWNEAGISTVTGSAWRVTTLRTLLSGPHLTGLRVHRGDIVGEGDWRAVLDRETWERIRGILGDPRRRRRGRPSLYLLTGLLKCSQCDGTLHHSIRADTGRGRYACAPAGGLAACGKIAIAAEPAEQIVTDQVLEALASPALFDAIEGVEEAPDMSEDLAALRTAENSLEELSKDFYSERLISRREYLAAREALDDRVNELQARISQHSPPERTHISLPEDVEGLRALWAEAPASTRREIIGMVVDKVVVAPGVRGRRKVDADRLQIIWKA